VITFSDSNYEFYAFISSFNPFSNEVNALSQRSGFKEFALEEFRKNPLGWGVGYLKAKGIDRAIVVGETTYAQASDAFLFIQLAEIGIVGFCVFSASLFEMLYKKTFISFFFVVGLFALMTGTDIPDFGSFYLVFILLSIYIMNKSIFSNISKYNIRKYIEKYCQQPFIKPSE